MIVKTTKMSQTTWIFKHSDLFVLVGRFDDNFYDTLVTPNPFMVFGLVEYFLKNLHYSYIWCLIQMKLASRKSLLYCSLSNQTRSIYLHNQNKIEQNQNKIKTKPKQNQNKTKTNAIRKFSTAYQQPFAHKFKLHKPINASAATTGRSKADSRIPKFVPSDFAEAEADAEDAAAVDAVGLASTLEVTLVGARVAVLLAALVVLVLVLVLVMVDPLVIVLFPRGEEEELAAAEADAATVSVATDMGMTAEVDTVTCFTKVSIEFDAEREIVGEVYTSIAKPVVSESVFGSAQV